MNRFTPRDHRLGRERLARLLPLALADAAKGGKVLEASSVAKSMMRHVTADNIDAVIVHRAEYGGWSCDVVLKKVPAGVANMFGTPANAPHKTEAEAEASALPLLTFGLTAAAQFAAEAAPRTFEYFGLDVPMTEDILTFMEKAVVEKPYLRYGSVERALQRLDEMTNDLFPDGQVTAERFAGLTRDRQAKMLAVLAMAMLEGLFRYPEWRAEPPGKNAPSYTIPT